MYNGHVWSNFDVAFLINSSAAFKSAFTTSSSRIRVSVLSLRECLDLGISSLAFYIRSAYFFFFSASSSAPSSSSLLVFLPLVVPDM